jgi:glycosyltransferase involved in cell wall biosynthesis
MKKICFLIGNINLTGGTERVTSLIANRLCKEDEYEVSILSLSGGMQPAFSLDSKISLCSVFKEKKSMKYMIISCIWRIRQYVINHKIDTLVVVDSISCVFTVPALFGLEIKHICWEHFNFNINLGSTFRNFGRKISTLFCNKIVVLTNSDNILWNNKYSGLLDRIVTIANPLPFANSSMKNDHDSKIVLAVGRLVCEKGFDLLLESWAKLEDRDNWQLMIVGSGIELNHLEQQVQNLNIQSSITFIPATNEIEKYYQRASILCLPSRIEGFGMVLIEAQSFGIPTIAFDIETGPKEIVVKNTGFLVKPFDTKEFSERIFQLMSLSEYEKIETTKACKSNVEKYHIENIITQWKEII